MEAILKVLEGDQRGRGRRTKRHHLLDLATFFNFVRGVLDSHLSHELERLQRQSNHVPIELDKVDAPHKTVAAPCDVRCEVNLMEIRRALFARLNQFAKTRRALLPVVAAWQQSFGIDDRIPKGAATDKSVHNVRRQAQEILHQIARREGYGINCGAELLGP